VAWDDFVGCDTTLGLGYFVTMPLILISSTGSAPPAIGIDFFQGPIIDGASTDTVKLPDGTVYPGKKMLKNDFFYLFTIKMIHPTVIPLGQQKTDGFLCALSGRDGSANHPRVKDGRNQSNPVDQIHVFRAIRKPTTGWLDQNESDRRLY
jgi:hypothetical protein